MRTKEMDGLEKYIILYKTHRTLTSYYYPFSVISNSKVDCFANVEIT